MNRILVSLVLAVLLSVFPAASRAQETWDRAPGGCPAGLHQQPNGPFAVFLFCEGALGTYLSVVYRGPIGAPSTQNGRWTLYDRYWYDNVWGSDVTGFRWSKDGTHLSISTSSIYGSGGYFDLDLQLRTAKQRLPKGPAVSTDKPGPGYDISGAILNDSE